MATDEPCETGEAYCTSGTSNAYNERDNNRDSERWKFAMLENYVNLEDILLIKYFAINQGHYCDKYCWLYKK